MLFLGSSGPSVGISNLIMEKTFDELRHFHPHKWTSHYKVNGWEWNQCCEPWPIRGDGEWIRKLWVSQDFPPLISVCCCLNSEEHRQIEREISLVFSEDRLSRASKSNTSIWLEQLVVLESGRHTRSSLTYGIKTWKENGWYQWEEDPELSETPSP